VKNYSLDGRKDDLDGVMGRTEAEEAVRVLEKGGRGDRDVSAVFLLVFSFLFADHCHLDPTTAD